MILCQQCLVLEWISLCLAESDEGLGRYLDFGLIEFTFGTWFSVFDRGRIVDEAIYTYNCSTQSGVFVKSVKLDGCRVCHQAEEASSNFFQKFYIVVFLYRVVQDWPLAFILSKKFRAP